MRAARRRGSHPFARGGRREIEDAPDATAEAVLK